MSQNLIRTTISLPKELLSATDKLLEQGKIKSRNHFITQAVTKELAALQEAEIDKEFTYMAEDKDYQAAALQIEAEFAHASWEALKLGEEE